MPPRHLLTMEPGPLVRGGGNMEIRLAILSFRVTHASTNPSIFAA